MPIPALAPAVATTLVTPSVALSILGEGISLCRSLLEYRQQARLIEYERQAMHKAADLELARIKQQFAQEMARLNAISSCYGTTLKALSHQHQSTAQRYANVEQQISTTINALACPQLPASTQQGLQQVLTSLFEHQENLRMQLSSQGNAVVSSFATFCQAVNQGAIQGDEPSQLALTSPSQPQRQAASLPAASRPVRLIK